MPSREGMGKACLLTALVLAPLLALLVIPGACPESLAESYLTAYPQLYGGETGRANRGDGRDAYQPDTRPQGTRVETSGTVVGTERPEGMTRNTFNLDSGIPRGAGQSRQFRPEGRPQPTRESPLPLPPGQGSSPQDRESTQPVYPPDAPNPTVSTAPFGSPEPVPREREEGEKSSYRRYIDIPGAPAGTRLVR